MSSRLWVVGALCLSVSSLAAPVGAAQELAALDAQFARRDAPGVAQQLEERLEAALSRTPDSFEHLWRLARLKYWVADAAPTPELKRTLGRECWKLGDRAAQLAPRRAEGPYYAAICVGAYGDGAGPFRALTEGLQGQFLERIDRALALDPWLERGGPLVARGRYHAILPWPKRDLGRARALYEQVLSRHPDNLRARYYLAQLQMREGHLDAAQAGLDAVQAARSNPDVPEMRRIQEWSLRVERELAQKRR